MFRNADVTTSTGLKAALTEIQEKGRAGWSSPIATELLTYADQKLANAARANNSDSSNAVSYAFELWAQQTDQVLAADDAWGYTRRAVTNRLQNYRRAETLLTDESKVTLVANREADVASFTGDDELVGIAAPTAAIVPSLPEAGFNTLAFRTAQRLVANATKLLSADADAVAEAVLEEMLASAAQSTSAIGAFERVTRETAVPLALGISRPIWLATARLLFGNEDGALGLIEALDTDIEPSTVKHIRLATASLDRHAA